MTYAIKQMTEEDLNRVLADWEADPSKKNWLTRKRNLGQETLRLKLWAIDYENDSYLFRGPTIMAGTEVGPNYTFCY